MGTDSRSREGAATDLERVDLARWQADPSPWRGQRPVVLDGAFADTTAVATWTPESLAARFPEAKVNARFIDYVTMDAWAGGDVSRVKFERMEMARFVSQLRQGDPCEVREHPLLRLAGLYGELDTPRVEAPPYMTVNLWIGNETRTPLHFDLLENLFVQVYGTKRFILEPPTSPCRLYLRDARPGRPPHASKVDPLAPDPAQFPEYHPGHQKIALVGPGDALYIPTGWFHDVTALDTSISVNCWKQPSAR